jgi:hypothetical protein
MIDRYTWPDGSEAMLRYGPDRGPVVVAALPLFEEANRTRTFVVTILRRLAQLGIASVLPDVPGQGESLVPLETVTLLRMREAIAGVVDQFDAQGRKCFALGVRSGALLDMLGLFAGRWHLSPVAGEDLMRELVRVHQAAQIGVRVDAYSLMGSDEPRNIAGNLISADMAADLHCALLYDEPCIPHRVVRLEGDTKPADRNFPGAPLWRRVEPDNDPALAALLADDIAAWIRACEG